MGGKNSHPFGFPFSNRGTSKESILGNNNDEYKSVDKKWNNDRQRVETEYLMEDILKEIEKYELKTYPDKHVQDLICSLKNTAENILKTIKVLKEEEAG